MKNARAWCVWLAVVVSLTAWVSCRKETGNLPNYDLSLYRIMATCLWSWIGVMDP
jgi:hypothetical protein